MRRFEPLSKELVSKFERSNRWLVVDWWMDGDLSPRAESLIFINTTENYVSRMIGRDLPYVSNF
jgi:hypothetical protein